MDPIIDSFLAEVRKIKLASPTIPYISNVTGRWIKESEATDPEYWASHLRGTVRFSEGLRQLLDGFDGMLLEVGPGDTLSTLAKQHVKSSSIQRVLASLPRPVAESSDHACILNTVGKLWASGVAIDWKSFHKDERRSRVSLPTYPFERQRYWIEPAISMTSGAVGSQKTCSQQALHQRRATNEYVAPGNDLERTIAAIWERLLGMEKVGVTDDFFSLGGHSLLATQLISEVKRAFDVEVPLHLLFEAPTIAGLSVVIEELLIDRIEALTDSEAEGLLKVASPPVA
jgi:acyl transferase domain-containing protein